MSSLPEFNGSSDSSFLGNGSTSNNNSDLPPFVITPIVKSLGKCHDHFLKFNNVMSIISFFISATAFIILIKKNRKNRHFPFNFGPLICLSTATFSLERTFLLLFKPYLDENVGQDSICWLVGFVSLVGQLSLLYWWMCSTVVLYQVIVKEVPLSVIRSRKKYYYRTIITIIIVLFSIQQMFSRYYYIGPARTCSIPQVELQWVVNYGHALLGVILFLALGTPVIRVLLRKRDVDLIDPERVSRLREEGVLQIILGALIFMTAVSDVFLGLFSLLYNRLESPNESAFVRAIAYPSCALLQVFLGTLGTLIGLAYICNKEIIRWIQLQFRTCFQSNQSLIDDEDENYNESVAFQAIKTPDNNSLSAPRTKCYEEYITSFHDNGMSEESPSVIEMSHVEEENSSSKTNTSADS